MFPPQLTKHPYLQTSSPKINRKRAMMLNMQIELLQMTTYGEPTAEPKTPYALKQQQ